MKSERKLTPIQTQYLLRTPNLGFYDVQYNENGADAYCRARGNVYRMVYDQAIKFTGRAYKQR